ncbi:protein cnppd1-like [Dermatophagoides farinae]|uniref:Protein CNPPD1 n=1 Tax=Dermatophagoides farinae TaxID=6954 RepID=A0A9D4NTF0_DERFA|nr:protein CNPPD1-like [Dermatophagoides farinae]KAH7637617.1 protein cnppd1-like [Dermatophagoides farinae]
MDDYKTQSLWNRLCRTIRALDFGFYGQSMDGESSSSSSSSSSPQTVTSSTSISELTASFESNLPLTEVTVDLIEKTLYRNGGGTSGRRSKTVKRLGKLDVNYASYILHQAALSPESVILAMIYLDRLKKTNSTYLESMTSSELFVASLVVATKFLYDKGGADLVYNDEWATFTNIDLDDLNQLERDFLDAIQWSCYVRPETFQEQMIKMEGLISLNEFRKRNRNTMTYMEMISSFNYLRHFYDQNNELLWSNLVTLINGILICTAAYTIAIGVVIASTSLVATTVHRNLNNDQQQNHSISISTLIDDNHHQLNLPELDWSKSDNNDTPISIFLSAKNFLSIHHHQQQRYRRKYHHHHH